jgi:hypothetical protein
MNESTPPEPDYAVPENRARAAQKRADELRERHTELAGGNPVTSETVRTARQRAEQSLERAKAAHRSASEHHHDAENAHRRAAAAHEQAALRSDDKGGSHHQDAAERHRDAAEHHESAAALQFLEYLEADKAHPTSRSPSAEERR